MTELALDDDTLNIWLDEKHEATQYGGAAWRGGSDDGLNVFLAIVNVPKLLAARRNPDLPPHFRHATWAVDLEVNTHMTWEATIHMERSFVNEERARSWFAYLLASIRTLTRAQLMDVARLTQGRMT